MKKIFGAAVVLCAAALLTACGNGPSQNEIMLANLTAGEQEIVDLLTDGEREILLFDYSAEKAYKTVDVWVEVYENGVLQDRPMRMTASGNTGSRHDGRMAVIIDQNPRFNFKWTISINEDGSGSSTNKLTDTPSVVVEPSDLMRAYGPMTGKVAIEGGEEILLYASVFTSGDTASTADARTPETLKKYEYAHLIKCKFDR
ncbi:MAG: hypothetical protein LBL49_00320 [Clostridiales Family XIII bacterium]|nr:hypothetical protein [Clostridiales Family XIII bacterium]